MQPLEYIAAYIATLKQLTKYCYFCDSLVDMLRDSVKYFTYE